MPKTLSDLSKLLEDKAGKVHKKASDLASEAALAIVTDLAVKTPVDTSKAISNWQTSLENPAVTSIPPHYPGHKGSTFQQSSGETIALAREVLKQKKSGQTIIIRNNLFYIRKLAYEDGSNQEPSGFVERAVLIGRKIIEKRKV